jgi:hypothetical protein
MKHSKRSAIRQLVNRETVYNLSDYSRKVSRTMGRNVSVVSVVKALGAMSREGQLYFTIKGDKVRGCLTSGPKAFQYV